MPYGISEEMDECEFWATVKVAEEGVEVIACHATKQEAIDHMVAISLEEGIEPLGEIEEPEEEDVEETDARIDTEPSRRGSISSPMWVSKSLDGDRSRAFIKTELRASGDGASLVGYASVFDSPSEPLPWIEYVKRGAFAKTLEADADVRLLMDHEGIPLARTKSGTLRLSEDEVGLRVEADLDPENPMARGVMSAMKRGDLSQMSFAFRTIKDSWSDDRSTRELEEVELFDVSVVTFPAYEATTAELRAAQIPVSVPTQRSLLLRKNQVAIARHKIGDHK